MFQPIHAALFFTVVLLVSTAYFLMGCFRSEGLDRSTSKALHEPVWTVNIALHSHPAPAR